MDLSINDRTAYANQFWQQHPQILPFCDRLSAFLHIVMEHCPRNDGPNLLYVLLFRRIVGNFDGMCLCARQGFAYEFATIFRAMLEAIFRLNAFIKAPEFIDAVFKADKIIRKRFAYHAEKVGHDTGQLRGELERAIKENKIIKIGPLEFAKKADMEKEYHLIYSQLCLHCHVDLRSLEDDCKWDDSNSSDLVGVWASPTMEKLPLNLSAACGVLVQTLETALPVFGLREMEVQLASFMVEYNSVFGASNPAT